MQVAKQTEDMIEDYASKLFYHLDDAENLKKSKQSSLKELGDLVAEGLHQQVYNIISPLFSKTFDTVPFHFSFVLDLC